MGVIDLGSRLELFVDDLFVDRLRGARRELQRPVLQPREPGRSRVCYTTILRGGATGVTSARSVPATAASSSPATRGG